MPDHDKIGETWFGAGGLPDQATPDALARKVCSALIGGDRELRARADRAVGAVCEALHYFGAHNPDSPRHKAWVALDELLGPSRSQGLPDQARVIKTVEGTPPRCESGDRAIAALAVEVNKWKGEAITLRADVAALCAYAVELGGMPSMVLNRAALTSDGDTEE